MRDDVITWSNGTTWTKVDGGDVAHAAFGDVERSEAQDAELEAADAVAPGDEPGLSDADFWEEALQREAAPEDSQPLFVAPCMADAECDAAEADPSPTRPLVTLPFTPRDGGEAPCAATGDGAPGEETSLRSAFSFADPCGPSPLAGDATARSDGADLPTWPEATLGALCFAGQLWQSSGHWAPPLVRPPDRLSPADCRRESIGGRPGTVQCPEWGGVLNLVPNAAPGSDRVP